METLGIYIHVPFCAVKCGYCDFYSVPYRKNLSEEYVSAVLRNLKYYSHTGKSVDTVYFGGGTPSLLSAEQIGKIIDGVGESFSLSESPEITLETNPNTVNLKKLCDLRTVGINRLSVGVQSMNDKELEFLGRSHTAERATKVIEDAYKVGFENISCDLMTALPNQTIESLENSIRIISELPVCHVSAYILKTEKGTPFDCDEIKNILPSDDMSAEIYLAMVEMLEKSGFVQYEISNFAKSGFESRHNCRYWKCLDYLGIGSSAHSCFNGKRFAVDRNIEEFILSDVQKTFITDENPCGFEEYAMLRLRLKEGLDLDVFPEYKDRIIKKIPALVKQGYAEYENNRVFLTPKGFIVSNSVIEYLIF